jgi:FlaA1/EpsC-like NDP-sugar epimerase
MTPLPRINPRTALAMLHDVAAAAIAWVLAFWLRLNLDLPSEYMAVVLRTLPVAVCVQAVIFWSFGLYRGIWRYASGPFCTRAASNGRPDSALGAGA